jgi:hypothetical protein
MRAELASIDDPRERRRFALGCTLAALRTGTGPGPWLISAGVGIVFAAGTLVASRAALAGGRAGIMGPAIAWPPLVLFAVALITSRATRSFRIGFVAGGLALLAGLIGMLVVSMVEAARWHDVAGVFLVDGDYPTGGLERMDAILDPIAPTFVAIYVLIWTPWPVLGAAVGSWSRSRARWLPRSEDSSAP